MLSTVSIRALCLCWLGLTMSASAADWPQWRGPQRNEISQETGLLPSWPEGGPKQLWVFREAGLGYSGYAVVGDTLYTMGAREDQEFVIAVNIADGAELWATPIGATLHNGWGNGPRGTPAVVDGRVYALGGAGSLVCLQAADGAIVWRKELKDFGGKTPNWGYCESVLVDGDRVLCTPGGSNGAVLALHKSTGDTLWQSTEFTEGAHYASIIPIQFNGGPQYVQLTMSKVAGFQVETGKLLWSSDWSGKTAVIPTPISRDGYVYITSGYGVGCKLVKLNADGTTQDVYENKVMKNHHGGVVLIGDCLYGHSDGTGWICQDFLTGEMKWNERQALGKGCLTFADGRLYCLDERSGTVALVEPSPEGWKEHGRFELQPKSDRRSSRGAIWTHPVVANGRLFLRDQDVLTAYDVRAQ